VKELQSRAIVYLSQWVSELLDLDPCLRSGGAHRSPSVRWKAPPPLWSHLHSTLCTPAPTKCDGLGDETGVHRCD
jgi:hypothetical protein